MDRVTRLTARLLEASAAMVSLIDLDRQVVVSAAGPGVRQAVRDTPLSQSMCVHVVVADEPLIVADARADRRWCGLSAVSEGEVAAYAGVPLHASGDQVLGTLCVVDAEPRRWSREELEELENLAAIAESEIALRLARTEAQLSETRMQTVLDRAPDAFVSIDGGGAVTAWNAAAERLFGWSPAEAVGRPVSDLIMPERLRRSYGEALIQGRGGGAALDGRRLELTVVDRTGQEFHAEVVLQACSERGEPVYHLFLHDITDRRRIAVLRDAQQAVAQALADAGSAEQAAADVTAAVTGVLGWACGEYWQVEPGGDLISRTGLWTGPGRDLSPLTRDQPSSFHRGEGLAGLAWAAGHEIWIPDLRADPRDFIRKPAVLRVGLRAAMALPVRSGRQVLGVLTFFSDTVQEPDDDLAGLLDGICAHVGRYMERRRAEELTLTLAASRRRFEQVVTKIDDHVWSVEVAADGVIKPVYVPSNSTKVFGGTPPVGSDMVAVTRERLHPDDLAVFTEFHTTLASGRAAEVECRFIGLDGVTRWVWSRATPRREGDRLLIDGISTDITERHYLAEERELLLARERQQVRRLQELDRMKDELVAVVSHELRNPVGTIRGYAEMLAGDPELTGEHRLFADVIDRKSAHLQNLVDDLLDLARFDAGHVDIDPRPVSLARLVRLAADEHRPAAQAKRLTVSVEPAGLLPVHADPVRLRQALDNLLSNAIKYTPDGGAVTVTAGREGGEVVLSIADTGIGIPPEQYPQLFTRFFRASTALESGVKGTGLGLAITRAIVTAHGGTIAARPGDEGGTVFVVRLPADPPSSPGSAPPAEASGA
nr:ATP-binding protein [Planomonospora venezuelensis]